MNIPFTKAQALGNDFVIILLSEINNVVGVELTHLTRMIADRRLGIGCDQVIYVDASNIDDKINVRFFNSDGSEAESCGNGSRAFALWWMQKEKLASLSFGTLGGLIEARLILVDDDVLVELTLPKPLIDAAVHLGDYQCFSNPMPVMVTVGNPHLVLFMNDDYSVEKLGPLLENLPQFPKRINVNFIRSIDANMIDLNVWERGAGLTPACGTGAVAAAVAAVFRGLADSDQVIKVMQAGGQLNVRIADDHVVQCGKGFIVFDGIFFY